MIDILFLRADLWKEHDTWEMRLDCVAYLYVYIGYKSVV
jgi:hypothetical protein